MVPYPAVSLVSINPTGSHNRSARDARALAQGRLSLLLALEIASTGRAATDRDGAARADPANEHGEPAFHRDFSLERCSASAGSVIPFFRLAWVSPRQARYSLPGMLKARELAPLIQIKPASGAALQFRLGLAGPRGSRGSDGLNDSRHATEEWKCD
jgi:hypothetical protein